MYDQNSQNGQSEFGGNQDSYQPSASSYDYVFSSGRYDLNETQKPKKRSASRIAFVFLTVLLCVSLSFGAGFVGAMLASQSYIKELNSQNNNVVAPPAQDELHNDDPNSILNQNTPEPSLYGSAGDEVFSISQVVSQVKDTVVVIDVTTQSNSFWGSGTATGSGSGVIISELGYILTCHHVVENATTITVTLNSGTQYSAALVGSDADSDLAVLRINPQETLSYAVHGRSANLVVGEVVVAIGNPLGTLGGTVTDGIISATERNISTSDGGKMTLLQTNAAINSGNSGGGLFNLDGELIGIVNAKYAASGVEGLAFAIPIDSALVVEKDLIQYGYVRGIVDHGLTVADVTQSDYYRNENYYKYYGIYAPGVYVVSSEYSKDLANADRILSVNGTEIESAEHFETLVRACNVGDTLTIVASRKGVEFTVSLVLQEYVPDRLKTQQ